MPFFRTVLVLAIGIAVLPSEKAQQDRLYEQASAAVYWTATFCDRNAQTCVNASTLWDAFLKKAEFAGKLAYDVAQSSASGDGTSLAPASFAGEGRSAPTRSTLTRDDLRPAWRGASSRQGI